MKKIKLLILLFMIFSVKNIYAVSETEIYNNLNFLLEDSQSMEKEIFLKNHPIGSIYITTSLTESTVDKMTSLYGGTWEVYANGRALVGTTETVDSTGGSNTVKLTSSDIPSISASGTTGSTGSGYKIGLTTRNASVSSWTGSHTHALSTNYWDFTVSVGYGSGISGIKASNTPCWESYTPAHWFTGSFGAADVGITISNQTARDYYVNSVSGLEAHTHSFTGNYTNSNQTDVNIQNPYIKAYIYRRTS